MKRSFDTFHLIDNTPMLMPDIDVEINYEDRESNDSGYDQAGYYHRFMERMDRKSWVFKYAVLTKEEYVYLRSLLKGKASFAFAFLNENEEMETVRAYAKPLSVVYQSKRSGIYKNLVIEIIEM